MALTTSTIQVDIRKPRLFKRRYEFWLQEKQVAVLEYKKNFGCRADLSVGDKRWDIRTIGFWKKSLEIIAQQSPYTKMNIDYNWKYKINFKDSNGNWYLFKRTGVWKSSWSWFDENGKPYIELKSIHFSRKARGRVTFSHAANEEAYLLMLIGWYLLVTYEALAAVAASSAS